MRKQAIVSALVAAAGVAGTAAAQDSVSSNLGGLPGDALLAWDTSTQVTRFVVDLAPFQTSWGTQFGIAPLLKGSKANTSASPDEEFFNTLISSQAISPDLKKGVDISEYMYAAPAQAEGVPGWGVNPTTNTSGEFVTTEALTSQFGVAFTDFAFNDAEESFGGVVTGVVNYDPENPNRLYVTRVQTAVNGPALDLGVLAGLGFGSVDADGHTYYRADEFDAIDDGIPADPIGGTPAFDTVVENNLYRTAAQDRMNGTLNIVSDNFAATMVNTDVLAYQIPAANPATLAMPAPLTVPNSVPASVTSPTNPKGVLSTLNFVSEYFFGATSPLTRTGAHLSPLPDHRGAIGGAPITTLSDNADPARAGEAVYTFVNQAKDDNDDTRILNVFEVDVDGVPMTRMGFALPDTLTDTKDPFSFPTIDTTPTMPPFLQTSEFDGYHSQHAFRGGCGVAAVNEDQAGRLLAAATVYQFGGDQDPYNHIAVARYTPDTRATEWTLAGWIDFNDADQRGKPITDGAGTIIGYMVALFQVNASLLGPSVGTPAIDAAGNVWFVAGVELFKTDGEGEQFSDFDSALLRAVYDPDTFSYELELVVELGDVFDGLTSGLPYQVSFISLVDSNSLSSQSFYSHNVRVGGGFDDQPIDELATSDPLTNGGVILNADIVYDIDGDGNFNDPTSANFDDEQPEDESYNVALYIGYTEVEVPCPADLDPPGGDGALGFFDLVAYLTLFAAMDPAADLDPPGGDGSFGFFDLVAYLTLFAAGCP